MSNFAIRKLVLIYIHKKETKDSQRSSCLPFLRHVLFGAIFCHVLFGAISIITRAGTRTPVHLFCDDVWRSKRGPNGPKKTWPDTSTSSTIMMNDRCSFAASSSSYKLYSSSSAAAAAAAAAGRGRKRVVPPRLPPPPPPPPTSSLTLRMAPQMLAPDREDLLFAIVVFLTLTTGVMLMARPELRPAFLGGNGGGSGGGGRRGGGGGGGRGVGRRRGGGVADDRGRRRRTTTSGGA